MSALDFSVILPELRAILNAIAGIPANTAQEDLQPFYFPQVDASHAAAFARVDFQIVSIVGWGYDEWRSTYNPDEPIPGDTYAGPGAPLGSFHYVVTGPRYVTVQIKVEAFDPHDGNAAYVYLERIRTRLGLPSVEDSLRAVNLAYQTVGASHDLSYDDDNGRRVSAAAFEIVFNSSDFAQDDAVTTIEIVDPPQLTVT